MPHFASLPPHSRRPARAVTPWIVALLALLVPATAWSNPAAAPDREIARCIAQAAGGKDWLEKTLWGLRDQEGGWIGAEVANSNGSHDLGPLQINSWWVPKIARLVGRPAPSVRLWLISDPCFNADVARWIFLSALHATGDYWAAIGVYHSPTEWRQTRYATSVATHMTRRFGPHIFAERGPADVGHGRSEDRGLVTAGTEIRGARMLGFGVVTRAADAGRAVQEE